MAKRKWLQSLDVSVGDDGLPLIEKYLAALAAELQKRAWEILPPAYYSNCSFSVEAQEGYTIGIMLLVGFNKGSDGFGELTITIGQSTLYSFGIPAQGGLVLEPINGEPFVKTANDTNDIDFSMVNYGSNNNPCITIVPARRLVEA